jgi:hypothetical protein
VARIVISILAVVTVSCSNAHDPHTSTAATATPTAAPNATDSPKPGGSPFELFATTTPRVGEVAPAFDLTDTTGVQLKLSDATARGPVVIVFGSFT